jgi:glucose-1-phosphate adenylyltransferase
MLPPDDHNNPYRGTADAIYRNMDFIESYDPECILVLPASQIYRMDYNSLLAFHRNSGACATIAARTSSAAFDTGASSAEHASGASECSMINAGKYGRVFNFDEKPIQLKNTLTSMGVYVFQWGPLKEYLMADSTNSMSTHDFANNILPVMLYMDEPIYAYKFDGYWRDVGTVESLWEANMEQLADPYTTQWQNGEEPAPSGLLPATCKVSGEIKNSVLSDYVIIGKNSEVVSSVIMPNAYIGENVKIKNAIIGARAEITDNVEIGCDDGVDFFVDRKVCSNGVSLVAPWVRIPEGMRFIKGSHIHKWRLDEMAPANGKQPEGHEYSSKIFEK